MPKRHRKADKKYKDTVFRDLFGSEERKEYALSLYNAFSGTSYTDPSDLQITTLDDVIYLGLRNDVSYLVGSTLSLWEHQSTYNPNMPVRGLKYFARLYAAYEKKNGLNEYDSSRLRLPTPRFVVIYVGDQRRPYKEVMRLSDSYEGNGDIEVTATVINMLADESDGLLDRCAELKGYVRLVRLVRENQASGAPFDEAVDSAVQQCIDEGVLEGYLVQRRAVVVDMFMDEYDEAKIAELFRNDGYRDGLREGRIETLADLVREGMLEIAIASERAGVSENEMRRLVGAKP